MKNAEKNSDRRYLDDTLSIDHEFQDEMTRLGKKKFGIPLFEITFTANCVLNHNQHV